MRSLLVTILLLISAATSAGDLAYRGVVVQRVVDADTLEVWVTTWLDQLTFARVRLIGVNSPELRAKRSCERDAALAAKAFTESWTAGRAVDLVVHGWDKFGGRVDGTITKDGESLADALVRHGHARPYKGEKRAAWCYDK